MVLPSKMIKYHILEISTTQATLTNLEVTSILHCLRSIINPLLTHTLLFYIEEMFDKIMCKRLYKFLDINKVT